MMEVKIDDTYMRSKELYCILAEDQYNKVECIFSTLRWQARLWILNKKSNLKNKAQHPKH